MKKVIVLLCLVSIFGYSQSNTNDSNVQKIKELLDTQKDAWNAYDIETFMETYWKSDELTFYGSGGVIKGWQGTLDRYKKSYPTKDHFGTLRFVLNDISKINEGAYYVMGEYYLTRKVGDTNGIFMLVVKNIDGEWKIVADTSAKVK